jgi:hypothetical protein
MRLAERAVEVVARSIRAASTTGNKTLLDRKPLAACREKNATAPFTVPRGIDKLALSPWD